MVRFVLAYIAWEALFAAVVACVVLAAVLGVLYVLDLSEEMEVFLAGVVSLLLAGVAVIGVRERAKERRKKGDFEAFLRELEVRREAWLRDRERRKAVD